MAAKPTATLRRYAVAINRLLPALLLDGWKCRKSVDKPEPGDIVMLSCAPPSEWDLSIYRESEANDYHLVESLQTGVIGRWSNVGFHVLDREKIGFPRSIEWTDEQFAFQDKFHKAKKRADFYMALPFIDRFDGDTAHIIFRTRFSFDDVLTPVDIAGWQKITQKALLAQLLAAEAKHKAAKPQVTP
mgnify:CR=1 FL=1